MKKKVRIIAVILIVAILIGAFSAISVIQAKSVDAVESVSFMEDDTSSISLKWNKVNRADGYHIYLYSEEIKQYELLKTIKDGKENSAVLYDFEQAGVYMLKVTAYKIFRNQEYEGDASEELVAYTKPESISVQASSDDANTLSIIWSENDKAEGYELQYTNGDEFDDKSQAAEIQDPSVLSYSVEELQGNDTYQVRIRVYFTVNNRKIYSAWSDTSSVKIAEKIVMPENIDVTKPMVALSFDDGPAFNGATSDILDVLEKHGARATFFMCGSRITDSTKEYLNREIKLGCEIGNHTYSHNHYGKDVTADDIKKSSDAIYKACGQYPTAFRCPGGIMSKTIQQECEKENMVIAYWSVDTEDWKSKDPDKIYRKVMDNVYDGSIILLHDIYQTSAEAVEKIVPDLIKEGYQIVTVSELISAKTGKAPKAGQQYIDATTINNNT